jgi:hypothetical protein
MSTAFEVALLALFAFTLAAAAVAVTTRIRDEVRGRPEI